MSVNLYKIWNRDLRNDFRSSNADTIDREIESNHPSQYCKLTIVMFPSDRIVYRVCARARAYVCLTLWGSTLRLTRPGKNPRTDLVVDIKMQVVRACAPFARPDISVLWPTALCVPQ